jgi:hypothetical protein
VMNTCSSEGRATISFTTTGTAAFNQRHTCYYSAINSATSLECLELEA